MTGFQKPINSQAFGLLQKRLQQSQARYPGCLRTSKPFLNHAYFLDGSHQGDEGCNQRALLHSRAHLEQPWALDT